MDLLTSLNIKYDSKRDFVLFRKHKDEIRTALGQGYTRSQIFRVFAHNYNLSISYSTFVRWINRELQSTQLVTQGTNQSPRNFE
jgi:hypothetical protein